MSSAAPNKEAVAEITVVVDQLRNELASKDHPIALTALLSLFLEMAVANPCCTQGCANSAMGVAMTLSRHAAHVRPSDASIH